MIKPELIVLTTMYKAPNGSTAQKAKYRCGCGNEFVTRVRYVESGHTKSCGCLKSKTKHGHSRGITYKSWQMMKDRCTNSKSPAFGDYGGRGINVCAAWLESFDKFLEDMGERPSQKLSIERLNVEEGYFKGNCVWASASEQAINKRLSKSNKSGLNGVCYSPAKGKWRAYITSKGKRYDLGLHLCKFEAVCSRKSAENKYHKKR